MKPTSTAGRRLGQSDSSTDLADLLAGAFACGCAFFIGLIVAMGWL